MTKSGNELVEITKVPPIPGLDELKAMTQEANRLAQEMATKEDERRQKHNKSLKPGEEPLPEVSSGSYLAGLKQELLDNANESILRQDLPFVSLSLAHPQCKDLKFVVNHEGDVSEIRLNGKAIAQQDYIDLQARMAAAPMVPPGQWQQQQQGTGFAPKVTQERTGGNGQRFP